MSGECEECGNHTIDCECKDKEKMISISEKDLIYLIYYARRYCDKRSTYAPSTFNNIYKRIRSENHDMIICLDKFDATLTQGGKFWPYAQDGMYNEETGSFDARI